MHGIRIKNKFIFAIDYCRLLRNIKSPVVLDFTFICVCMYIHRPTICYSLFQFYRAVTMVHGSWTIFYFRTFPIILNFKSTSVCIATGCGMDGPWIESRYGRYIHTCPDRPWGPTSLLYSGYWICFPWVTRPGCGVDHPSHLASRLKKE
jgi:hypothetical protein